MDAKAYYEQGLNDYGSGSIANAIKNFCEAIRLEAEGQIIADKGALDGPINDMRPAAMANTASDTQHFNLGVVYHLKGYLVNAIQQYEKILEHAPDNAVVHNYLGMVYIKKDKLSKAIKEFQEAVRLAPNDTFAKANLERAMALRSSKKK